MMASDRLNFLQITMAAVMLCRVWLLWIITEVLLTVLLGTLTFLSPSTPRKLMNAFG